MEIKVRPMGLYETNCYIVEKNGRSLIIDPGIDATDWVVQNAPNPLAILNTHGHFDHVWSNKELKERLNLPIYCPRGDAFMLENDPFGFRVPPSSPDINVRGDTAFDIGDFRVTFRHFPGHTPGCSVIEIDGHWFCGDFLFRQSIGRCDFPFSDPAAMIESLNRAEAFDPALILHPGHGPTTTLGDELPYFDRYRAMMR